MISGFPAPVRNFCDQFQREISEIRNLNRALAVFVTLLISDLNDSKVIVNTLSRMVAATFHWEKMPERFCFFAESNSIVSFLSKLVGKEHITSEVLTESAFKGLMEADGLEDMMSIDMTEEGM